MQETTSDALHLHVNEGTISLLTYNIEGIANVYHPDTRHFLSNYDVVLLCETFAKEFPNHLFPAYDIFVSPGVKLSDAKTGRLSGGIAILVRKRLMPFIKNIKVEYDNCIVLRLAKELTGSYSHLFLIGVYLPPRSSMYYAKVEIDNGIDILEQCIMDLYEDFGETPLIVFGDLNARTGNSNAKNDCIENYFLDDDCDSIEENDYKRSSKDSVINDCGNSLLNVCEEFSLLIVNGLLPGDAFGDFTYIAHNGSSVIDYFLVSRCLINLAHTMCVIPKIESKHMPVELILKSTRPSEAIQTHPDKVIQKYVWDQEKVETYCDALASPNVSIILEQAIGLLQIDTDAALDKFYEGLFLAGQCMKRTYKVGTGKPSPWFDIECKEKKTELRLLLRKYTLLKCENNLESNLLRNSYTEKRREYKCILKKKKADHKKHVLHTLEMNNRDSKKFWGTIKSARQRLSTPNSITQKNWFDHFKKVFNNDPMDVNVNVNRNYSTNEANNVEEVQGQELDCDALDADISVSEVEDAIKAVKNGKASGIDGLSGEFYKYSSPCVTLFLTKLFNKLFDSGTYPTNWCEAVMQPIHKKGDVNSPDNYRGISLLNSCSKLYSFILNRRLTIWVEDNQLLHEAQAGFRKDYSTIDHIFSLLSLVQKQLLNHSKLYVAFIDFRKAFDYVNRNHLWFVLRKKGIKGKMYNAIKSMYAMVKARVRVDNEVTESFVCPSGLKQGENCSPILFCLLINELADDIMQNGKHGIALPPHFAQILIMLFADDVVLLSDTVIGLQRQLNVLHDSAKKLSLTVNREKSKIIVFRNGGHIASIEKWFYEGKQLEIVNAYKYLGVTFSTGLTFSYSLAEMADKAKKGVSGILRFLWSLGENSPKLFFKLFDCQIQPMLTYGSEVWGLKADHTVIERVHLFAIKRLLNVSIKTPNTLIYCETGRYPLYIQTHTKCLKYWLTLLRMPETRIPKMTYLMLLDLHYKDKRNWATDVCYTLYRYGFGYVWENQGVEDVNGFLVAFRQRLFDCHLQHLDSITHSKERFTMYSTFRQLNDLPQYLFTVKNPTLRKNITRIRLGVSMLKPHQLRYTTTNENKDCPFCKTVQENEIHFILTCPEYNGLREMYIPKKFYVRPNAFKLSLLLADTRHCIQLALFLTKAFAHRNDMNNCV